MSAIFSRAVRQLATGLVLGAGAALTIDSVSGAKLLEGKSVLILPAVAVVVMVVGVLATLGPVRRGLRIQPTEALRAEG
jgi:hypothetical protein